MTEEPVMTFPEVIALQDIADSAQELPLPLLLASKPITKLKFQQDPKDQLQSVTHEEVCCTLK